MAINVTDPLAAVAGIVGDLITSAATTWVNASTILTQSFKTITEGMNLVKGVSDSAFGSMQRLVGAINSSVAAYTQLFNPAATRILEMAVRDLNASIGEALMPVLRIATAAIRSIADVIASMSPQARALVAGLVLATVSAVAMTAAVGVLSAVMNTATAGIPALLGAIAGGLSSLVVVAKPLDQLQKVFSKVGEIFEKVFDTVGESFAKITESFTPLVELVVKLMAMGADQLPGLIGPLIDSFGQLIKSVIPAMESILPAIMAVGAVIENINILVIRLVIAALAPLLEIIGELLKPIAMVVEGLALVGYVITVFVRTVLDQLMAAFKLLQWPMEQVKKLIEENLGPSMGKLKASMSNLWDSIKQVFGLLFDAFGRIAKVMAEPFIKLAQFVGGVLVVALQALAYVIETVASWITTLADNVRLLFGVEKKDDADRVKKGSSVGKATVQASFNSVDSYLDKARASSFGLSRGSDTANDPAKQTASNTGKLVTQFETFNTNFSTFMEAIGSIGDNIPSAGSVAKAASFVNPAAMQAMALRELMRRLG